MSICQEGHGSVKSMQHEVKVWPLKQDFQFDSPNQQLYLFDMFDKIL